MSYTAPLSVHLESIYSGYEFTFIKTEVVFIPVSLNQILVVDKRNRLLALKIFHHVVHKNTCWTKKLAVIGAAEKKIMILFVSPD